MACNVQNMSVIQKRLFHARVMFVACDIKDNIESKAMTAIWRIALAKIAGFLKSKAHSILIHEITLAILFIFFNFAKLNQNHKQIVISSIILFEEHV